MSNLEPCFPAQEYNIPLHSCNQDLFNILILGLLVQIINFSVLLASRLRQMLTLLSVQRSRGEENVSNSANHSQEVCRNNGETRMRDIKRNLSPVVATRVLLGKFILRVGRMELQKERTSRKGSTVWMISKVS